MGAPDKFNLLNDLLVETKVATEEELAHFLHESGQSGSPSLWAYMRKIGRLTQPQADTLEMAAKGYIPVEAARVSISVQGRMTTGAGDVLPKARTAEQPSAARGLLKMQRPGRELAGTSGAARSEQASTWSNRRASDYHKGDSHEGDSRKGEEKEVSSGRFEALLADNIIALPTIRPTPRPEVDTPPPPSADSPGTDLRTSPQPIPQPRRTPPRADPSSVAAWKQIVDSVPRNATPRPQTHSDSAGASSPPVTPRPSVPNWLQSPGARNQVAPATAAQARRPGFGSTPAGVATDPSNGRVHSGLVGRRLGKFQISSQIGRGSSGSVYMGHHVVLNMPVAIKVLDPGLAAFHPELLKRFKHEARSAARIAHPNIVRVVDCDHIEGYHIIVMEYVDGISVSELVKINGQVAEERALIIVQAVAEGLEAALECGIIHRDIKPANIMITKNKQVKLADLGLAKRVDDPTNMSDTRPNIGLGTPHYFAPEQASNAVAADHRSDIYSLGATLYNMLTGSVPFKGKTIAELIRKHHEEPLVPPHTLVPQLSRATSDLTVYMMAKRPEDRPQNYADLLNAINASIYNLKNRQSQSDGGSKTGSTIVRDILNLFSTRK